LSYKEAYGILLFSERYQMKKHKLLPFIICITILLVLSVQESLKAKSPLFLDIEKEGRSCEIKDYSAEKSSLIAPLPADTIMPVLTGFRYFYAFFAIAETPAYSKIPLPLLCKLVNHSPPVSL
jgi:hypothetical protein